ncbi:MAG TPA: DUF2252 domain-containing protein [Streptosporangiaceae bacterium]|nr:DUF2252 domain-containing protein [Streptosporangiaceae bacterium]
MTETSSPRSSSSDAVLPDLSATNDERRAAGKAARKRARRGTLGYWAEEDRGHDPLKTILAQNQIRLPALVPIRHHRMAASPWNYYRGGAAVMAADLASQPDSGLVVQLCGDAHILNFGLWATPERNLSFDLRDFDETLPGPFEWDVKRFAASVVVAARENRIKPARAAAAVSAGVEAYRRRMRGYTMMPELDIWYDGLHVDSLINYFEPADRGRVSIHIEKKRKRRTSRGAFAKLTTMAHGRPRITEEAPLRVTISDDEQADLVDHLLAEYRMTLQEDRRSLFDRFTEVDVVRQVVGVGSVGMAVYLVLLEGRTGADPLFLQVKQAGPSVYEARTRPSRHLNHGARVINGKRLVQTATDIFVGWGSLDGKDYYVRQFRDMKIIPTTELIAPRLVEFATACGETLARAHARTGDPVAIDGYIGTGPKFAAAIGQFARRYADQNERDHAKLVSAIAAGAVESLPG